ncbi:OST-HTH/LOTUS domain-containing protein [Demequina litorisediminis]|uniref:HTH OST-type domain-containing protein n=1 Tax=Demequina litorisediminis TaxID=1849022 RepID=A0ABQ6IFI7_9MICO|nr:OST-HTH/LOTUS domain-containing protein [Demequina litorisediminis]GMA35893.1 hypothetical protein GCM10025876_20970 [Demequina litorisediminis]
MSTAARDDDWAHLGAVGSNLARLASDFDSRTWGYSKLKDLLIAHPAFDIKYESPGDGKQKVVLTRRKGA